MTTQSFNPTLAYEQACADIISAFEKDKNEERLIGNFIKYSIDMEAYHKKPRAEYVETFLTKLDAVFIPHNETNNLKALHRRPGGVELPIGVNNFYKNKMGISRTDLATAIIAEWNKRQPYPNSSVDPDSPLKLVRVRPLQTPSDSKRASSEQQTSLATSTQAVAQAAAIDKTSEEKHSPDASKKTEKPISTTPTPAKPRSWGHFFVRGVASDLEKVALSASASATIATIWLIGARAAGHENRDFIQPISKVGDFLVDNADALTISAAVLGGLWLLLRAGYSSHLADKQNSAPTANAPKPEEEPLLRGTTAPSYGSTSNDS